MKGDVLPDPMPVVRSEVQELQSPALIRAVVHDLNLAQDPEFNGALRPPGLMARFMELVLPRSPPRAPPLPPASDGGADRRRRAQPPHGQQ